MLDIIGVPEKQGECVDDIVKNLCNGGLGMSISSDNIKKCYRVKSKSKKIVVVCDNKNTRDEILKKKRAKKQFNTNEFGFDLSSKISIFEGLTFYKQELVYKANEARKN